MSSGSEIAEVDNMDLPYHTRDNPKPYKEHEIKSSSREGTINIRDKETSTHHGET